MTRKRFHVAQALACVAGSLQRPVVFQSGLRSQTEVCATWSVNLILMFSSDGKRGELEIADVVRRESVSHFIVWHRSFQYRFPGNLQPGMPINCTVSPLAHAKHNPSCDSMERQVSMQNRSSLPTDGFENQQVCSQQKIDRASKLSSLFQSMGSGNLARALQKPFAKHEAMAGISPTVKESKPMRPF